MKSEKEKDEEDILSKTENIMKKIQEQMSLTEEALNRCNTDAEENDKINTSKSMYLPRKKVENQNIIRIKDSSLEFVNLEQNFTKKPDNAIFDDFCSLCSSKIYYIKYICVVCKDCILCPKCEIEHEHPTVKCKFPQLSTLKDIYVYINTRNAEIKNSKTTSVPGFISDIFWNKCEFKLECNSNQFSMRKNQAKNIPIALHNLSGTEIDMKKYKLTLFGRNNKDLKVHTKFLEDTMNKNEKKAYLVKIESNDVNKVYDFTIEVFSSVKMKSNILNFKVEINEDEEDEELNEYFTGAYPDFHEILIEATYIKKGIKKILEDTNNKFDREIVLNCLKKNKGNVDETIFELNNKSNK